MQDHELRGFLGHVYDETTPEQRDAISRAADQIAARWPDPDLTDLRTEAMNAALAVILGDDTDTRIAEQWTQARHAERMAHAQLTGAIIAGQIVAPESESSQAERLGVTRVTLRKALGR